MTEKWHRTHAFSEAVKLLQKKLKSAERFLVVSQGTTRVNVLFR
ncbi:hypothetical protein ABLU38_14835 (plasmid) [Enterococcus faecalis ATCC 29212]